MEYKQIGYVRTAVPLCPAAALLKAPLRNILSHVRHRIAAAGDKNRGLTERNGEDFRTGRTAPVPPRQFPGNVPLRKGRAQQETP